MPAAEMISGTIIGEIRMLMISARCGMWARDSPRAASVPRKVASRVEAMATRKLFLIDISQLSLVKKSSYQRSDQPSGSRVNISRVKVK